MKRHLLKLAFLVVLSVGASLQAASRTVLLNVDAPPVAWADGQLYEKLERSLATDPALRVIRADASNATLPELPNDRNNLDSLVNWGQEAGGRFLVAVTVDVEDIVRKKSFGLPLVFQRYSTVGVIEGQLRVFDLGRGKLLLVESFDVEIHGPRVFQGEMDDNIDDPDIHLSAVQKLRFISELEDKAAEKLKRRVNKAIRNR